MARKGLENVSDMDPLDRQDLFNERHEGDGAPVAVNHFQAMKCAAVIQAGLDGHTVYAEASRTVARFLQASAMEADAGYDIMRPTAAELWRDIDDLPWPLHGGPAPQPDLE